MRSLSTRPNPFMMMMNPEAIIDAMERSERLNALQSRVCRPLDRPLIPKLKAKDLADFDREIDQEADLDDARG